MDTPRAQWFVADGSRVTIGDLVRIDLSPDLLATIVGCDSQFGLPLVSVPVEGGPAQVRLLYPGQILGKAQKRRRRVAER
ncbi:hypothetical protein Cme02nite_07350 [Catellatospora methionotrophica]|uniref:Uncharacterized protein n=2 Tax=Catellatospora methionotrophica TaxID=121620 RepID=A0A8J3L610_9ACTN|nr:hypothetical protein Cme02nite_07350 [Catellatospora methionotrophica]